MELIETSKFRKLRGEKEREALKAAIMSVIENPEAGKKLKGEFRDLRSLGSVKGQSRRLIYKVKENALVLFSFGPREGIYR